MPAAALPDDEHLSYPVERDLPGEGGSKGTKELAMKHVSRLALLLFVLSTLNACGRSGSQSSGTGEGGGGADPSAAESGGGSSGEGPIRLTEKRLQEYIAYKKESNGLMKGFYEEMGKLAQTVDSKSSDATKAVAAMRGVSSISAKQEAAFTALRKKHGFTEDEDNRLWDAINEVVAAKSIENPALEPSFKIYRDMQARGGEEKKAADEFFAELESTQKEGLAKATEQYGAECVDILAKHVEELRALQMDALQQMLEAQTPPK